MGITVRVKEALIWSHYLLSVAGLSALGYCAVAASETSHYQERAREQLRKRNSELATPSTPSNSEAASPGAALPASSALVLGNPSRRHQLPTLAVLPG
jgi:hypothetical protein